MLPLSKSNPYPHSERAVLLFDFDDTLSEHASFIQRYVQGIARVLSGRFGGETAGWAQSALDMLVALEQQYITRFSINYTGYNSWYETIHRQAMPLVFGGINLEIPDGIDPEELSRETQRLAMAECDLLFPGVRETIYRLRQAGFPLHMASGNNSGHLRAALAGARLTDCFDRLYGPDLIDCAKEGPLYYERIFADLGIAPKQAVIIDDHPLMLQSALDLGARAIQMDLLPNREVSLIAGVLGSATTIPAILDILEVR